MNYYNENDPGAAAWLRELIKYGHISNGIVDERSIEDVKPAELTQYKQCHFFAGIGAWSYSLRLAGWDDDEPVWTGSCPCQPFSAAGRRKGTNDERHLWPAWHWLIGQSKPNVIFGEQVASKDGLSWLDLVSTDLEGSGYAIGSTAFPACGVGAPHKRERIWFVADADMSRKHERASGRKQSLRDKSMPAGSMEYAASDGREQWGPESSGRSPIGGRSTFWSNAEWLECIDGKKRAIEPGTFPLAHGLAGRMGRLRGYGNAIVAEAAAQVIGSYRDLKHHLE